ncbi:hypothetical protein DFJ58DRAFT_723617 [Suillus subalutaceus]|uniref:uncharacterized protein n=1 Tax=Suillus subalutaceus TaxID=48586 RepID=UPI001B86101F|nr:uncharacterized protein DFJ58DRAFT_723617 [Suillus subalutaceus]KAG1868359.1 hypothetical protein DFJ58DRAFT_723617 [Suillus subalutaceus]
MDLDVIMESPPDLRGLFDNLQLQLTAQKSQIEELVEDANLYKIKINKLTSDMEAERTALNSQIEELVEDLTSDMGTDRRKSEKDQKELQKTIDRLTEKTDELSEENTEQKARIRTGHREPKDDYEDERRTIVNHARDKLAKLCNLKSHDELLPSYYQTGQNTANEQLDAAVKSVSDNLPRRDTRMLPPEALRRVLDTSPQSFRQLGKDVAHPISPTEDAVRDKSLRKAQIVSLIQIYNWTYDTSLSTRV